MKGRNLNVSDTASAEHQRIPPRSLGRLAAGMRASFRGGASSGAEINPAAGKQHNHVETVNT